MCPVVDADAIVRSPEGMPVPVAGFRVTSPAAMGSAGRLGDEPRGAVPTGDRVATAMPVAGHDGAGANRGSRQTAAQGAERPAEHVGRRRVKRRKFRGLSGPVIIAAVMGAASFAILTGFGDATRKPSSVTAELDRIAGLVGMGLNQVQVSGHKFTADVAILDQLDLDRVRSLVSFNALGARDRIEKLPWIATASITRLLPDGLAIVVTERTPFAVWQLGERDMLIDASGRRLSAIRTGGAPDLPRIAGPGAPDSSVELFALLARYPEIAGRLQVAERIGERRWTLRLTGDLAVLLPVNGRRLIDVGAGLIDLRHASQIIAVPANRAERPPPTTGLRPKLL
jgi:cell division protein FtsQ